jgi:hypothetical protein
LAQSPLAGLSGYWDTIPDFTRTDADVSLFFFTANSISYTYPNTDPMFGATSFQNLSTPDNPLILYNPDILLTSIGCTDQYQICNPVEPGPNGEPIWCTSLSGIGPVNNETDKIGLNGYQLATAYTVITAMDEASSIYDAIEGRGSAALKAQNTVFDKIQQAALPNNQWQIEVDGWFAVSLAGLQQALVERALGPTDVLNSGGTIDYPTNDYGKALCKRQMIRNVSGYENFSVLGVAIILVIGGTLVFLGSVLDDAVGLVQKLLGKHYGLLTWTSDGYLQLQRLAYEGAGYGDWERCADDVPHSRDLARGAQMLGPLDISDINHPRLVGPTFASASLMNEGLPNQLGRKEFWQETSSVEYE